MNFISRIIKSINAMRERLKIERHEAMYGPHFNEECALKAVSKMENEDGSRGEHWSLEEATSIANQYGINLKSEKFNKYDWYVALNMVRSDYYRAIVIPHLAFINVFVIYPGFCKFYKIFNVITICHIYYCTIVI